MTGRRSTRPDQPTWSRTLSRLTADTRGEVIAERVVGIAEDGSIAAVHTVTMSAFGPEIFFGGISMGIVTEKDAALQELDAETLAEVRGTLMAQAITDYRERRTDSAMEHSWSVAAGWTAIFVAFCTLFWIAFRYAMHHTNWRVNIWVSKVEEKTGKMAETEVLVTVIRLTIWLIAFALLFLALYYCLSQVLFSFPATRKFAAVLLLNFSEPVLALGAAFLDQIPNFVALFIIYFLTRYVLKIIRLVFQNIEPGVIEIKGFEQDWTWLTFRIVRAILLVFALVIAYPYVSGSDSAAFQGISIFLGVILSLGSSLVIGNLLAGLFVIYRRGVNQSDFIEIDGYIGKVESVMVLETLLRNPRSELISIPNSRMLNANLTSYSKPGKTRGLLLSTKVGIGYEAGPVEPKIAPVVPKES